ncbi:phosphonate C-P lyase system protein PhnL [Pseudanabaena sp. PCC 6802]|uniref:phosphonate C-P lyase system protein PhnL n=1 Tax=Pseudanabaena sp. PCC 6802 TaxID=118173 RepID=UPI000348AA50|nr:phosphonate C-P lyase system protein PhnL [Pseudanabaena sp. PCC 6802]
MKIADVRDIHTSIQPTFQKRLQVDNLHKSFTLHQQGGTELLVLSGVSLTANAGECIALTGPSGSGKSTFMRCLYGNYHCDRGEIWIERDGEWVDLTKLEPHELLELRRKTIGYVSQFLRVIPRVPALQVAAEPLLELGIEAEVAEKTVGELFCRLNLPERLWQLSPTTFSGGEKQRVNIARALVVDYPILLLDEPTSALDAINCEVVVELLEERKARGCTLIGIFHDREVRSRLCNRDLSFTRHNIDREYTES